MDNSQQAARRYWFGIERTRVAYMPRVRRYFKQALQKQIEPILKELTTYKSPQDVIDSCERLIKIDPIHKAMERTYKEVGVTFARRSFNYVKSGHPEDMTVKEDEPKIPAVTPIVAAGSTAAVASQETMIVDQWTENMVRAVNSDGMGRRITSIKNTTKVNVIDLLTDAMNEAIEEGLGTAETSIRMRTSLAKDFGRVAKFRADRIARTEMVAASNMGSLAGVLSTGLDMMKYWISTPDTLTRTDVYDHLTPGQPPRETVELDNFFTGTGESLMYPGDPAGSPGNVINCRCTLAYISRERYLEEGA